jgi:E3 ubiquitin-protein ligase HUWE1
MEVFDEPSDDLDWRDEAGTSSLQSNRPGEQQTSLLQELRNGIPRSISQLSTPNLEPFLDSSLANDEDIDFEDIDETHGGIDEADGSGVVALEAHEYALQSGEEDRNDNQHEWSWTDTDVQAAEFEPTANHIVNRVWATLASNSRASLSRPDFDPDIQIFRRPRTSDMLEAAQSSSANLANPILSRPIAVNARDNSQGDQFSHWIESIEALIGGGAVQLIGDIMRRPSGTGRPRLNGSAIRLQAVGEGRREISPARIEHILDQSTPTTTQLQPANLSNEPIAAVSFFPMLSLRRYQDEAMVISNAATSEYVAVTVNALLDAMRPSVAQDLSVGRSEESTRTAENDVARPQIASQITNSQMNTAQAHLGENEEDSHGMDITAAPVPQSSDVAREIISIRGQELDVTGLGIDLEFLEALPEDMREEVLTQHIRERL